MLGLSDKELSTLRDDVFTKFDTIEEVILFGSRARGTHQKASDVDLAIKGKTSTLIPLQNLLIPSKKRPICRIFLMW